MDRRFSGSRASIAAVLALAPSRLPPVHCVLTGSRRAVLERRRSTATAPLRSDPRLAREPEVTISFCLLEDLQAKGPFAPIFRDVRDPGRRIDWLGVGAT